MNKTRYAALMVIFVLAPAAFAGLTQVYPPSVAGEDNHVQILTQLYGQDYIDGVVTATRIDDYGKGLPLNLVFGRPGDADDKVWTDGIANLTISAVFAGYNQEFGYDRGGGYVKLLDAVGTGYNVSGSGYVKFDPGTQWNWVRSGKGGTFYSDPDHAAGDNMGLDHMVTYYVEGLKDGYTTWLVFWEDIKGPYGSKFPMSDRDYNDLVVEIKGYPVPVPGAIILGGFGVGIVSWLKRRRSL